MRRWYWIFALAVGLMLPVSASARQRLQGNCEQGGNQVLVANGSAASTTAAGVATRWQQSFPSCLVTVKLTGTATLASIFSDNAGTVLANPFTAASDGSWFFYTDARVDVTMSGGGISTPFTRGDFLPFDPAAAGNIDNIRFVDGGKFAKTAAGINAAVADIVSGTAGIIVVPFPGDYSDAVITLGKKHVLSFGAGTFTVAGIRLPDSTTDSTGVSEVVGLGPELTLVQLANNKNVDVIANTNFSTFTGGANFNGVFRATIANLTIDGNKANNTSGFGIRLYGRGYIIDNVIVQNCIQDGVWTEWGGTENDVDPTKDISSHVGRLMTIFCRGAGWTHKGPNDLTVNTLISYMNGTWGWDVYSPTHAAHVNVFLDDMTTPGTAGGIRLSAGGGIHGTDINATNATGWGMLQTATAGSSNISAGTWSGFAGIALEIRTTSISTWQGVIANSNAGIPGLKINGGGNGFFSLSFSSVNTPIAFISEIVASTIIAQTDGIPATWFTGTPHVGDMLLLGRIPGRPVSSGVSQFPGTVAAPSVGPSTAQQHTLPAVASDTVALLAAAQTLTNKVLNGPGIAIDVSSAPATSFRLPTGAGFAPTVSGQVAFDSTANQVSVGVNGINRKLSIVPTLTQVKGSGAANYTTTSSTFADMDAVNLALTVTIPTGSKLSILATGSGFAASSTPFCRLRLVDGATEVNRSAYSNTSITAAIGWSVQGLITGDGLSHTVKLQFNSSDNATICSIDNSSALNGVPVMTFTLQQSN